MTARAGESRQRGENVSDSASEGRARGRIHEDRGAKMTMREELELLEQIQLEVESDADQFPEFTELDRRKFVFLSLVTAAARTVGFGARALAQAPAGGRGQAPQAPLPPVGEGEPVSWTFQPYPGGTGALMEKLIHERGAAAFQRASFTVEPWTGPVPTAPEEFAFLPAHRLSALIHGRKMTST